MGRRIGIFGLVNYRVHPTEQRYRIFSFNSEEEADMMQEELEKRNIWFERNYEEIKGGIIHLFGVDKRDFKGAQEANFAVSAKYRNPMIKNKLLRYALVILTVGLVAIGIIGYVKNKEILEEKTEQLEHE